MWQNQFKMLIAILKRATAKPATTYKRHTFIKILSAELTDIID